MDNKYRTPVPATIQTTKVQEELAAGSAQQQHQQQLDNFSLPPKDSPDVGQPKAPGLESTSTFMVDQPMLEAQPAPASNQTPASPPPPPPPPPPLLPVYQQDMQQTSSATATSTSSIATMTPMTSASSSTSSTSTTAPIFPHTPTLSKSDCNSNSLATFVDDDEDDDKDENEVVSEVENQHSSFNIHPLSQFELEMYDNDNILFSDYI